MSQLVTQIRRGPYHFHDPDSRLFLLPLQVREIARRGSGLLFRERLLVLSRLQFRGRRLQNLPVRLQFRLQSSQLVRNLSQFGFGIRRPHDQFLAAFFVMFLLRQRAVLFQVDRGHTFAVLSPFALDGVTTLRAFRVFRLELLHCHSLVAHVLRDRIQL